MALLDTSAFSRAQGIGGYLHLVTTHLDLHTCCGASDTRHRKLPSPHRWAPGPGVEFTIALGGYGPWVAPLPPPPPPKLVSHS
jgi:hypothetical protein